MAVILPPGFAQVLHHLSLTGDPDPMLVTYGISISAPGSLAMAQALDTEFNQHIMQSYMSNKYTFFQTTLRVGQDAADPIIYEYVGTPSVGVSSSAVLPSNCAVLVRKVTAVGGRRNRGRFFLPGWLPETSADENGVINSTDLANRQTYATSWFNEINTVSGVTDVVVLHSAAPATPTVVTSFSVQNKIATQRRRMRR